MDGGARASYQVKSPCPLGMMIEMSEAADKCVVCDTDSTNEITVKVNPGIEELKEPMTIRIIPVCEKHLVEYVKVGSQAFFDKHPEALS